MSVGKYLPLSSSIMIDVTNIEVLSKPFQINDIRHLWLFLSDFAAVHVLTILKFRSVPTDFFLSQTSSATFIGKASVAPVFNVYNIVALKWLFNVSNTNWDIKAKRFCNSSSNNLLFEIYFLFEMPTFFSENVINGKPFIRNFALSVRRY